MSPKYLTTPEAARYSCFATSEGLLAAEPRDAVRCTEAVIAIDADVSGDRAAVKMTADLEAAVPRAVGRVRPSMGKDCNIRLESPEGYAAANGVYALQEDCEPKTTRYRKLKDALAEFIHIKPGALPDACTLDNLLRRNRGRVTGASAGAAWPRQQGAKVRGPGRDGRGREGDGSVTLENQIVTACQRRKDVPGVTIFSSLGGPR